MSRSRQRLREFRHIYKQAINELILEEEVGSAQRVELLEEIAVTEQDLIEAKRRVNVSAPLLRLPREIIGEIAALLAYIWPPFVRHCQCDSQPYYSRRLTTIGWISFSHVCYSLRVTLLDIRSLWAHTVQHLKASGQREVVERAGSLPLSLSVGSCLCSHSREPVGFTRGLLARAREISTKVCTSPWCINATSEYTQYLYDLRFSFGEFPFLEEAEIQLNLDDSEPPSFTRSFWSPPIIAPRLRRLSLRNFHVPFSGEHCPLTHLNLECSSKHVLPEPSQFLDMLRSCNKLQELSLSSWIPDISPSETLTISFPFLKTLRVRDISVRCLRFWTQVDVPPTTHQAITFIITPSEADSYIDPIGTGIASKLRLPVRSFSGSFGDAIALTFSDLQASPLDTTNQALSVFNGNTGPCLNIRFEKEDPGPGAPSQEQERHHPFDSVDDERIIQYAFRYYNLASSLGFLYLPDLDSPAGTIYSDNKHEEWRTLLQPLTNLHTLHVQGDNLHALIYPLTILSSNNTPLLPCLRLLWSNYLNLSHSPRDRQQYWPNRAYRVSKCASFLEMLSSRARAGKGIESTVVPSIRAIVPHFETNTVRAVEPKFF